MTSGETLPMPSLDARLLGAHRVPVLTDDALFDACGVRIVFTGREGGVSDGPYASMNLGMHVKDNPASVKENRARLLDALGAGSSALIVPNQVHGTNTVTIDAADAASLETFQATADEGADALVVAVRGVAALLNFADCTPVIVASPTGRFAIAHAGWRGAVAGIAGKAVAQLAQADAAATNTRPAVWTARYNVYIGPHIRQECFETGEDVADEFARRFGQIVVPTYRHVSMANAVSVDVMRAGVSANRILDAGICTKCNPDEYFSYRASGGVCGRHGAAAYAKEGF